MAKITYLDPLDDAPKIDWQGVTFRALVPIELDDTNHKDLIKQAREHPYFKVEDGVSRETAQGPIPAAPAAQPTDHLKRRDPTPDDIKWVLDFLRRAGIEEDQAVTSGTASTAPTPGGDPVSHNAPPGENDQRRPPGRPKRYMTAPRLPPETEPVSKLPPANTDPTPPESPVENLPWST